MLYKIKIIIIIVAKTVPNDDPPLKYNEGDLNHFSKTAYEILGKEFNKIVKKITNII